MGREEVNPSHGANGQLSVGEGMISSESQMRGEETGLRRGIRHRQRAKATGNS